MTQEPATPTAEQSTRRLRTFQSDDERRKIQRYFTPIESDQFIGVRMGQVFDLAKTFIDTAPAEPEKLLDSPIHEVRAGAHLLSRPRDILYEHAATMPRVTWRYAVERLDPAQRTQYLAASKAR